jgi:uncharacterized protein YoxC
MIAAQILSGMWLQDAGSISSGNSTLLMIFVGIVALAMLVQAIALVMIALGAAKARNKALGVIDEVRAKALPAIEGTEAFLRDYAPKLMTLAENLVETSAIVRNKVSEFDTTLTDVNNKTRTQAARVDGIVTNVLTGTADVVNAVQHGIRVPLREITGVVNGLKAGLDVLVGRAKGFGGYSRTSRTYRDDSYPDPKYGNSRDVDL